MIQPITEVAALHYPAHMFSPEDFLVFVQASRFSEKWDDLNLDDTDLNLLEIAIMSSPKSHPVVPGTGGLRKLRFKRQGKGKRGGFRICFVFYEEVQLIHLLKIYPKNEQDDLTTDEKNAIRKLISETKKSLSNGNTFS